MNWSTQLLRQAKFDLLMFRRNPAATFFTVILPLIFLVLFISLFGNEEVAGRKVATYYVPGILALSIISATAVNVAITMTTRRERGVLKRVRGTPLRPWVFAASQGVAGIVISLMMSVVVIAVGRLAFGVSIQAVGLLPLIISILVGAIAFSPIGLALTAIIPSEDASPAVTNAIFLPLYFISDVFIPPRTNDQGVIEESFFQQIGNFFPVKHLNLALSESFDPFATSTPWPWDHWLIVLAWGAFGLLIALKYFRWTPNR